MTEWLVPGSSVQASEPSWHLICKFSLLSYAISSLWTSPLLSSQHYLTVPVSISPESGRKKPQKFTQIYKLFCEDLKPGTRLSIKHTYPSLYLGMFSEQSSGISSWNKMKVAAAAAIAGLLPAGPRLGACWGEQLVQRNEKPAIVPAPGRYQLPQPETINRAATKKIGVFLWREMN